MRASSKLLRLLILCPIDLKMKKKKLVWYTFFYPFLSRKQVFCNIQFKTIKKKKEEIHSFYALLNDFAFGLSSFDFEFQQGF